jgi:prepilin-type N-terminal cleavage/methylation domain-containing protein
MKNQNKGFTLVEIMVAIVIGVISIAAAFSAYGYFNKTYNSVSQKAAINNSAREALSVISRDLKNVGYVDINYTKVAKSEIKLIYLQQKILAKLGQNVVAGESLIAKS